MTKEELIERDQEEFDLQYQHNINLIKIKKDYYQRIWDREHQEQKKPNLFIKLLKGFCND